MSETTGPHCFGLINQNLIGSCGLVSEENKSKLRNFDADGSGELCIYGRHVFMGYLNNESATKSTFNDDGWLSTGDLAKIEHGKYIFITGRLKELIITAGCENVAPVPIEDNVKAALPDLISNCMVIGDKKKYLVLLCTLKVSET
jgi:long-chain-fatty-acid--CoA ligase ACSBG